MATREREIFLSATSLTSSPIEDVMRCVPKNRWQKGGCLEIEATKILGAHSK